MEMMPFHPVEEAGALVAETPEVLVFGLTTDAVSLEDWRTALPVLAGPTLTLRELEVADAAALFEQLTSEEVSRFISPPPTSVAGFEKFIRWARDQRAAGQYACFAVVPEGGTAAIGLFQIRVLDAGTGTAEWGFALGRAHWGTGVFLKAARRIIDFAFERMAIQRLEARAVVPNGRGNGALFKVGAVREAVLHRTFERFGERLDQVLWTISRGDWILTKSVWGGPVH